MKQMITRAGWLALLLSSSTALAQPVQAQDQPPPPPPDQSQGMPAQQGQEDTLNQPQGQYQQGQQQYNQTQGQINQGQQPGMHGQQGQQQGQLDQTQMQQSAENVQPVDLLFDTNQSKLGPGANEQLKALVYWAACTPKGAIILEGHADPRGTVEHNMALSARRAAAVRNQLIKMGVPKERIIVSVYGETGPQRATFAQDRRVVARVATTQEALQPSAITASRAEGKVVPAPGAPAGAGAGAAVEGPGAG